ncbi:ribonuclease P protein subunit [Candidatus Micrarchaeota archaeon]|nr:ribonuclease P protein subunit [Candidatus Micrarchaeota archaeon]
MGRDGRAAGWPLHLMGEFIGKHLKVLESPVESFYEKEGKIVDETKNTFVIEAGKKEKIIPKKGSVFEIGRMIVRGDEIMFRAEERPKKLRKKIR